MNKELMKYLEDFQHKQPELLSYDVNTRIEKLGEEFEIIARQLLYGGCFVVYSGDKEFRKVYLHTVEFYYHEEAGDLKDYIVYHKHKRKNQEVIREVDYFTPGTLNAHQSGIDITFESDAGQYRASALVRAFMVKENGTERVDHRSTYLYDELFTNVPMPIKVEWMPEAQQGPVHPGYRVNVCTYGPSLDDDGNPAKNEKCPDKKPWAFSREEFPEKYRI